MLRRAEEKGAAHSSHCCAGETSSRLKILRSTFPTLSLTAIVPGRTLQEFEGRRGGRRCREGGLSQRSKIGASYDSLAEGFLDLDSSSPITVISSEN